MYWDRFDIVEAWYLALTHCHGGQWSPEYERLCKMQTYYKPGLSKEYVEGLTDNGREIYEAACKTILG